MQRKATLAEAVTEAIRRSYSPEATETALKFMKDNGLKISEGGKRVAFSMIDGTSFSTMLKIEIQAAIMALPEPEEIKNIIN